MEQLSSSLLPGTLSVPGNATSMSDASDKCLSILALQDVPAVQPVLIEGSAKMLILYWRVRGQAVVFPEQD